MYETLGRLAMLSPQGIATISAEIEKLRQARLDCRDTGLVKVTDAWIEAWKRKLEVAPQNNTVPAEERNRSASAK
jgi:hypothetical protein